MNNLMHHNHTDSFKKNKFTIKALFILTSQIRNKQSATVFNSYETFAAKTAMGRQTSLRI